MQEIAWGAKIENIHRVTAFIGEELEKVDCPIKARLQLDVAIDELFSNIARYAFPGGGGTAAVRFAFDKAEPAVSVTFLDRGVP